MCTFFFGFVMDPGFAVDFILYFPSVEYFVSGYSSSLALCLKKLVAASYI